MSLELSRSVFYSVERSIAILETSHNLDKGVSDLGSLLVMYLVQ